MRRLTYFLLMIIAMILNPPLATAQSTDATPTLSRIVLGMGCFWGGEKRLSALHGVVHTEVGYAGGKNPHPTYHSVLAEAHQGSGELGHAEVVAVDYDPHQISTEQLLIAFFENHDPTQGDRQGNDVGPNYRSVIFYTQPDQKSAALHVMSTYQKALSAAGYSAITTQVAPLEHFYPAEEYHQRYLQKHPDGYCGLGGTGVTYPGHAAAVVAPVAPLEGKALASTQLVVFEGVDCGFCRQFEQQVLVHWKSPIAMTRTLSTQAPLGWHLKSNVWATPTTVLFQDGQEVNRFTGFNGDQAAFWNWLGHWTLTPEQRAIAFEGGTEPPHTGSLLDNHAPGTYVDTVSGQPLFRSNAKFGSHSGWPSFFDPVHGAIILREDDSHGMHRLEVLSASSGIHLGHVFDDGPPPTGKRYCINSAMLRFVPD
ncbi:MAG: peptide-methionine (S)-S-oxide reductase MsrA [Ferrovum sp.]|nr:peptide-methionine (S)-S-oxide reductase MsrA [Ferrovum sp.]NDU87381.1 peptide-methionine (S)-S-oxide reductase MsrA [Ferrovum sp.]